MRWRRATTLVVLVTGAFLLLPFGALWAHQLSLAYGSEQQGRRVAAGQLYDVWRTREAYLRPANTMDHPFEYPYLKCDAELPSSLADVSDTLTMTLMSDHGLRLRAAYARMLGDSLSIPAATGLTACIEATPFASRCADHVRHLTYGQNDSIDLAAQDAKIAAAYCRSVHALLDQARAK